MPDFTPVISPLQEASPFRFWCQTVLPAEYDDALSYYELLAKLTKSVNALVENIPITDKNFQSLLSAYKQLQSFVNDYFNNLDVTKEINAKLDEMASDGTLSALILPYAEELSRMVEDLRSELESDVEVFNARFTDTDASIAKVAQAQEKTAAGLADAEKAIQQTADGLSTASEKVTALEINLSVTKNSLQEEITSVSDTVAQNRAEADTSFSALDARMDTFASLPSGSTSADAELQDIRVTWNGKTLASAGEAVRAQAKQALNALATNIISTSMLKPPYDDLNTAPPNQSILYSVKAANSPGNGVGLLITFCFTSEKLAYPLQIFADVDGNTWIRSKASVWTTWHNISNDSKYIKAVGNASTSQQIPDFNTVENNSIWLVSGGNRSNGPTSNPGVLLSYSFSPNYKAQIYTTTTGKIFTRSQAGSVWTAWLELAATPLADLSLFEKFGVIGDSYASGEMYFNGSYVDNYSVSWGKILARKCGNSCLNLSEGGLTTRTWLTSEKGLPLLKNSPAQDLYFLALGINDYYTLGGDYLGTPADLTTKADSFYGNYAKIVDAVMSKAPHSKLIFLTTPGQSALAEQFNSAIAQIATHYGTPCLVLNENPFFLTDYYRKNLVEGHPIAILYSGMANAIRSMTEAAIPAYTSYFKDCFMH